MAENNMLTFHEKVEDLQDEQEALRMNHLEYLKEVVTMITEQGNLIQTIQGQDDDDDTDIDMYVGKMEGIVQRNLEIYSDMAK